MSEATDVLKSAIERALAGRPKVGGFPHLAETLRQSGVTRNIWNLPSCQSIYIMDRGSVAVTGTPLVSEMADIPSFDRDALIAALRTDQAGNSSFAQFLEASWRAGVVHYEVDFCARTVSYYSVNNDVYVEGYPHVEV